MIGLIPDDFDGREVLWTWERMIEKTVELWRGNEQETNVDVDRGYDHTSDILYIVMGVVAIPVWLE